MPPLRNWILRPEPWLAAVVVAGALLGADSMRAPQNQLSVRVFTAGVAGYHNYIQPFSGRFIRCRYNPTCSVYSVEAVRKYGIVKGGWMGVRRIARCQKSVTMGTNDPVP